MYKKLLARRQELNNKEGGFTLIELLVVVVIIGILVAIAIPLYLHFENGAHTSAAQSDVNGIVQTVKQCESDNNGTLPATLSVAAGVQVQFPECTSDTYNMSSGDSLSYTADTTAGTFTVAVANTDSGKTVTFDSSTGQTVTANTVVTAP